MSESLGPGGEPFQHLRLPELCHCFLHTARPHAVLRTPCLPLGRCLQRGSEALQGSPHHFPSPRSLSPVTATSANTHLVYFAQLSNWYGVSLSWTEWRLFTPFPWQPAPPIRARVQSQAVQVLALLLADFRMESILTLGSWVPCL